MPRLNWSKLPDVVHHRSKRPELQDAILERLSTGESLLEITRDPQMPNRSTLTNWMMKDEEFFQQMMNAYQFNALYMAEAIMDVVDGGEFSTGNIERDKLKVSAIKWLASKYNRTMFGDHMQVTQRQETVQINLPAEFGGFLAPNQQIEPKEPE